MAALTRLVLAGAEMRQRLFELEKGWIIRTLLDLGDIDVALEYIRDGHLLLVEPEFAMDVAKRLWRQNIRQEATMLFSLAEPLDLLHDGSLPEGNSDGDAVEILRQWAANAPFFKPVNELLELIKNVPTFRTDSDPPRPHPQRGEVQAQMLYEVGMTLLEEERAEQFDQAVAAVDSLGIVGSSAGAWLNLQGAQKSLERHDLERATRALESAYVRLVGQTRDIDALIRTAELAFRLGIDTVSIPNVLDLVPLPLLDGENYHSSQGDFSPFRTIFAWRRLKRLLGDVCSPFDLAETDAFSRAYTMRYFIGCVAVIADLSADAWRGLRVDEFSIGQRLLPLLRVRQFRQDGSGFRPVTSSQLWNEYGPDLYKLLVQSIFKHGPDAVEQLRRTFEEVWAGEDAGAWRVSLKRSIIAALGNAGVSKAWCGEQLRLLEDAMLAEHDVNGRIVECQKQCEALLEIDDWPGVRRNIRTAIEVSLGVGYRKDHQLDDWIEWLPAVNRLDPDQAESRIRWFAHAVASLVDSTEGRAATSAGANLLKVAFESNPGLAISMFWWFLDKRVLPFSEGCAELFIGALDCGDESFVPVQHATDCLLLPISTVGYPELAAKLVETAVRVHGRPRGSEVARWFIAEVSYASLPSARPAWLEGVKDRAVLLGLNVGPLENQGDDSDEASWHLLKRGGGESALNSDEVFRRTKTVPELLLMLAAEAKDSFFNWGPVVTQVVKTANVHDLHTIAHAATAVNGRASIFGVLSRRAAELGEPDLAWSLGYRAVEATQSYGWDRRMDSDRSEAFGQLIKLDPMRARKLAYDDLVRVLTSDFPYPQNIARNLYHILPIIAEDRAIGDAWPMVEAYVRQLFGCMAFAPDEGLHLVPSSGIVEAGRAICDLIVDCIEHPTNLVAGAAQRCARTILLTESRDMINAIRQGLQDTFKQRGLLNVVESICDSVPEITEVLLADIARLRESPDIAVRQIATRLCAREDACTVRLLRVPRELPSTYRFAIPWGHIEAPARDNIPEPGQPLRDSEDPEVLLQPLQGELKIIARAAGLSSAGVFARTVEIMQSMSPQAQWSASAEDTLRHILGEAGLKFTFRRRRTELVRRALFRVVAELFDAGVLDEPAIDQLDPVLRHSDSSMLAFGPSPRPLEVTMLKVGEWGSVDKAFMTELEGSTNLPFTTRVDGWNVLAEDTRVQSLDWDMATETREALAFPISKNPFDEDGDLLFPTVYQWCVREYGKRSDGPTGAVSVRNRAERFDYVDARWLALDPTLGFSVGWHLHPGKYFSWIDPSGRLMVRTVSWSDGGFQRQPPHPKDQAGCGWLVLATDEATEVLGAHVGGLHRAVRIKRSITVDNQVQKKDWAAIKPLL